MSFHFFATMFFEDIENISSDDFLYDFGAVDFDETSHSKQWLAQRRCWPSLVSKKAH